MNGKKTTNYYIGDLAKNLDVSQRTIRYYEELGFLKPSRTDGGFRVYTKHDADVLRMIMRFKDLGMRLEEIRALFLPSDDRLTGDMLVELKSTLSARRKDFEERINDYNESISQIDELLKLLSKCSNCGASSETGICRSCLVGEDENSNETPIMSALIAGNG